MGMFGINPLYDNVGGISKGLKKSYQKQTDLQQAELNRDLSTYQTALQKALYGSLGPEFRQGLDSINSYLATQGPLFDSGARGKLASRLASNIYGKYAQGVSSGSADFISNYLRQRQLYNYQLALQKAANKKTGLGGVIGGLIGTGASAFLPSYGLGLALRGGGGLKTLPLGDYPASGAYIG